MNSEESENYENLHYQIGHLYVSVCFLILATWWSIRAFVNFKDQQSPSTDRKRQKLCISNWRRPLCGPCSPDILVKIPGVLVLVLLQVGHLFGNNFYNFDNFYSYFTIEFFYIVSGVIDIITVLDKKFSFLRELDHSFLFLATVSEPFLLSTELAFRNAADQTDLHVHKLLIYAGIMATVGLFLEMCVPDQLLCGLVRPCATYLKSFWLLIMVVVKYSGRGKWPASHESVKLLSCIFLWFLLASMIFVITVGVTVPLKNKDGYETVPTRELEEDNEQSD